MGHSPHFSCSLAAARSQCVHSGKTRHGSIACIYLGRELNSLNTRSPGIKLRKYQINVSPLPFFLVTTLSERAAKVGDSVPSGTESDRPFFTNSNPKKHISIFNSLPSSLSQTGWPSAGGGIQPSLWLDIHLKLTVNSSVCLPQRDQGEINLLGLGARAFRDPLLEPSSGWQPTH